MKYACKPVLSFPVTAVNSPLSDHSIGWWFYFSNKKCSSFFKRNVRDPTFSYWQNSEISPSNFLGTFHYFSNLFKFWITISTWNGLIWRKKDLFYNTQSTLSSWFQEFRRCCFVQAPSQEVESLEVYRFSFTPFFLGFLLEITKYYDFPRFSRGTAIFQDFPGRYGILISGFANVVLLTCGELLGSTYRLFLQYITVWQEGRWCRWLAARVTAESSAQLILARARS